MFSKLTRILHRILVEKIFNFFHREIVYFQF
jgi:hypothetical protein